MSFRFFPQKSIFVLALMASFAWCLDDAYAASLRLNWTDTSTNESGFKIERMAGNGGNYIQIATVSANVKTYTDASATPGATYCYRVRAFNASGTSAPSNAGCETAPKASSSSSGAGSSNGSNGSSSNGNGNYIPTARLSSKWNNYRATMKIRSTDDDAIGVMFRYQDNENYYRFSWYPQEKFRRLEKRVGGIFKVLAHDWVPYRQGQTYSLQIVAQGSALKILIDGKTIFSVTDTSLAEGTIGLYSYYNTGSSFDDIVVEDLNTSKVVLSENFNDHDHAGWTIIDEGNDGGPSQWSAATGALVQSRNIGSAQQGDFGTYALFTRGSWQDYRVAVKMRSTDDDPLGLLFRFQDSENYYRFTWDRETAGRRLIKRENGVFKVLAKDSVHYVGKRNYQLEIIAQGSSLKVNIDGKKVFSVTDKTFQTGTIALYSSHNKGTIFDNVFVEEISSKSVLLSDDFNNGNFAGWTVFEESGTSWGPSDWSVVKGELVQNSNIGSDATGNVGTLVIY
jgi:Domain of Unknown Function (DUF1080)